MPRELTLDGIPLPPNSIRELGAGSWKLEADLRFFDRPDLAALVITAMRADLVGRLRFAALRTAANRHRRQRIMRTPLGRARFGMAAFGIRHVYFSFFNNAFSG